MYDKTNMLNSACICLDIRMYLVKGGYCFADLISICIDNEKNICN